MWPLDGSGEFTVRAYYRKLIKESLVDEDSCIIKEALHVVWNSWMPSKVKIFAWRLLKDRLATRVQLVKRNILEDNNTSHCAFGCLIQEDTNHLFLNCIIAKGVWLKICAWLGITQSGEHQCCNHFLQMVEILKRKCSTRRVGVVWAATCWSIWKHRNDKIFNNGVSDIDEIVHKVKMFSWWWLAIGNKQKVSCNFYEWNHSPLQYM
ncbi:uncharacterized protein LOC131598612 [Vicia villosa]|uniref:uncharacterized protein LOC131598612 n=1 Tax=Vicia villosa TaxID=3911 RepID=UPI00273A93A5|nr:uncharacterized protein LOC131598612 [Vicia villosa]